MCEILEHLDEPEAVVAAAFGRLKPGGRFLTCPHDHGIPDPEHVRLWGHDELFHLLAPYGDTISFRHFPPPYFHVWMLVYLTNTQGTFREATANAPSSDAVFPAPAENPSGAGWVVRKDCDANTQDTGREARPVKPETGVLPASAFDSNST